MASTVPGPANLSLRPVQAGGIWGRAVTAVTGQPQSSVLLAQHPQLKSTLQKSVQTASRAAWHRPARSGCGCRANGVAMRPSVARICCQDDSASLAGLLFATTMSIRSSGGRLQTG